MRNKLGEAFAVSPDIFSVRFGLGFGDEKSVVFDLATASLKDSPTFLSGFASAKVDGLPVMDWRNNAAPKFDGARLRLSEHEAARAMAIWPDSSGFVMGSAYSVRAYNAKGEQLWHRPGPSVAWGVDFSADGDILAVAYGDGTIRWLRWKDGEELLAFFVEPQSLKWVAWTPTGYYMASPGGEDLIGWHVNRGWDQPPDFFAASQFRAQYNRPDIVRLVLQTRDEAEAVRRANGVSEPPLRRTRSSRRCRRSSPSRRQRTDRIFPRSVEIAYSLRSPSGLPIDRLDVLADGQPGEQPDLKRPALGKPRAAPSRRCREKTL